MRTRPLTVVLAAILLVLVSLTDFPFPWEYLFPGAEEPPAFVLYLGLVLGVVGLVVAIGLWLLKSWSFWAAVVVGVLNILLNVPAAFVPLPASLQAAIAATTVVALIVVVLVLLPSSRTALRET